MGDREECAIGTDENNGTTIGNKGPGNYAMRIERGTLQWTEGTRLGVVVLMGGSQGVKGA
jgi:hypothetical protein